jgi:ligand-binding sensor domain-containing protein/signal transduction histidine kinase
VLPCDPKHTEMALRVLTVVALILWCPRHLQAERLPIKFYTTVEGLAHNSVNRIVRDARGFLWFATNDGLSRFDGYTFTNYSVEQGLPHRTVTDLLETSRGDFWVATSGGLVRFRPDGIPAGHIADVNAAGARVPMFATIVPADADARARAVIVLLEARDGTIWCGTRKGLFRLDRAGDRFDLRAVDLGLADENPEQKHVNDLVEDEHGTLWAATPSGLYRRWADGTTARYSAPEFPRYDHLHDLMKDHQGRLWVGSRYQGFFRIAADASHAAPVVVEHHGYPSRSASWIYQLLETSERRFWAATNLGIVELLAHDEENEARLQAYNRGQGLSHQEVTTLAEDVSGNLWLGTWNGAMRIARNGFVTFAREDGLASGNEVFDDVDGQVYVHAAIFAAGRAGGKAAEPGEEHVVPRFGRLDGRRFSWFMPGPPFGWGWVAEGSIMRTRRGEWWLASGTGFARYPPLRTFSDITAARPIKTFTKEEGLPEVQVYRMFEDSREDVWFSIVSHTNGLFLWNHATDTLRDMAAVDGFPAIKDELPRAFGEDAAGDIWIGLNTGVARYRDGKFRFFTSADGLPPGAIVDVHADAAGRIWLAAARGGLIRVDQPAAERPAFAVYTTADGLSGNAAEVITEDRYGRIYVATGHGIDQLDPATARVRAFTTEDGLAPGLMLTAFRDREGALWFGTHSGLSRFVPPAPAPSPSPPILITGLTVAGQPYPISAVGEAALTLPDLPPDGNQLQIDFASLRFAPGERLRYQYRLDGADRDWSPLSARRNVSYASLSPGQYRFVVRAVNADGLASATPASIAFTVLPPFWLRSWFVSLAVIAIAAAALALHRSRVARVLEIERVRTRIATDLHDDIGANLTRIAILSEVARQHAPDGVEAVDAPLSSIATIARESATSMSDIVWAISPDRDTLSDVVGKMRDHAEELFESRDIALVLDLPDAAQHVKMGVDVRRDLYLVFKEAVNNAARHSGCTRVAITLRAERKRLLLEVADNGVGFDPASRVDGNGLASMRRRADRLGASLAIDARAGAGTTVTLATPIGAGVALEPTPTGR